MHNITLISTRHESLGACDSIALYQIMAHVNPQVIFEEVPPTLFNDYYQYRTRSSLESETITRFKENHKLEQVLVDSEKFRSKDLLNDYELLIKSVETLTDINGVTFRNEHDQNEFNISMYGFEYLNSIQSINQYKKIYTAINNCLQTINNEKLFQTFELWKTTHDNRENHMLQKIYEYCEKHKFERAIFTIGVAHRNGIIEKISKFQEKASVKLNWIY